jgi:hypothetical protein
MAACHRSTSWVHLARVHLATPHDSAGAGGGHALTVATIVVQIHPLVF